MREEGENENERNRLHSSSVDKMPKEIRMYYSTHPSPLLPPPLLSLPSLVDTRARLSSTADDCVPNANPRALRVILAREDAEVVAVAIGK